jgi:nitroreductase
MPTAKPQSPPATAEDAALDLLLARRSVRHFTGADITPGEERQIIDAAFAAPSGNNTRPWHFVFVRDPVTRSALQELHEWTWMLDRAPLVVAVLARAGASPWWIEDGAAAIENMLTMATALGIGSVWCGMRDEATEEEGCETRCRALLDVPDEYRVLALVGFGRPAAHKKPRTQVQTTKLSFERFGRRSR